MSALDPKEVGRLWHEAIEQALRPAVKAAAARMVRSILFDIACGRRVDGVIMPAAIRVRTLRSLRRAWDREERKRCADIVADGIRAGVRVLPKAQPWPRLEELPPQLRAAAEAKPRGKWRDGYLLDPHRTTAFRLGNMADRVNRAHALDAALKILDAVFPTTPPRSQTA